MKIDMEYVKKNSGRWALYGARLGLASALAIFAAHLMGLQFETQAGVICIFSMLTDDLQGYAEAFPVASDQLCDHRGRGLLPVPVCQ